MHGDSGCKKEKKKKEPWRRLFGSQDHCVVQPKILTHLPWDEARGMDRFPFKNRPRFT